jgi:hypothetical protein
MFLLVSLSDDLGVATVFCGMYATKAAAEADIEKSYGPLQEGDAETVAILHTLRGGQPLKATWKTKTQYGCSYLLAEY